MIVFFSNFISEHQIPFCDAMYKKTGGDFRFVATKPISRERLEMGFTDKSASLPYVINAFESDSAHKEALLLGYESDIAIIGAAPDEYVEKRLEENKLTFRYSERFFKKTRWRFDPRAWKLRYKRDVRYRKKNLYMLCASAYTARDCRFIGAYPGKTYRWGYFPQISETPYEELRELKAQNDVLKIIWVSRWIKLKHPEEVIKLAKELKNDKIKVQIEMLGTGELREGYEKLVKDEGLGDMISFSGPFEPSEVLERMRRSDIFLFTSDKNEGWGAVMNEAMSCACAAVACREIGSVPYLVKHGENGLIYDKRGKDSLYRCVRTLTDDKEFRERLQKNAYDTMRDVWNADTATDRLLHLTECLREGRDAGYTSGPCSRD